MNQTTEFVHVATGCRDSVIRIWKIYRHMEIDIELCDELRQHENYITSLATNYKFTKLYSSDWNGVLLEFTRLGRKSSKEHATDTIFGLQRLDNRLLNYRKQQLFFFFSFCRKIKVFPTSILKIELHPKSNRIYVQCANDPMIYAVETTTAIVMQSLNSCIDHMVDFSQYSLHKRPIFTIAPCGTQIYTNNGIDSRVECINLQNDTDRNNIHIPSSLTTRKMTITMLSYHPNKHLIACSVFGSFLNATLYLIASESVPNTMVMDPTHPNFCFGKDIDLERDLHYLEEYHNKRAVNDTIGKNLPQSNTVDSILNRIDDLFFIAIQTPKHTDDYEQLKDMQVVLDKLQPTLNTPQTKLQDEAVQGNEMKFKNDSEHSASTNIEPIVTYQENEKITFLENDKKLTEKNSKDSKSSHETFIMDDGTVSTKNKKQISDDGTYSIESGKSKQSNLTFEINK